MFQNIFSKLFFLFSFFIFGVVFLYSASSALAVESGLDFSSGTPYFSSPYMKGSGSYVLPSTAGSYSRQLQVCIQYQNSSGSYYNTTSCKLYSGTAKSVFLTDSVQSQSTSTNRCWRTWSWYWTSYDNTSRTATATNCSSGKKPFVI